MTFQRAGHEDKVLKGPPEGETAPPPRPHQITQERGGGRWSPGLRVAAPRLGRRPRGGGGVLSRWVPACPQTAGRAEGVPDTRTPGTRTSVVPWSRRRSLPPQGTRNEEGGSEVRIRETEAPPEGCGGGGGPRTAVCPATGRRRSALYPPPPVETSQVFSCRFSGEL